MREKICSQIDGDGAALFGGERRTEPTMNFINMKTDKKETETQKDEKGASRDDD